MGQIKPPPEVKYFAGVLLSREELWEEVKEKLIGAFGNIEIESPFFRFNFTNYYEEEMGNNIWRKFVLFEGIKTPELLADYKIVSNEIEQQFAGREGFKRPVNIDPGYFESSKVILASTKNFFHRIYIGKGIFAEVTMHWRRKKWNFFEWTYPDYRTPEYGEFFKKAREIYLKEISGE